MAVIKAIRIDVMSKGVIHTARTRSSCATRIPGRSPGSSAGPSLNAFSLPLVQFACTRQQPAPPTGQHLTVRLFIAVSR